MFSRRWRRRIAAYIVGARFGRRFVGGAAVDLPEGSNEREGELIGGDLWLIYERQLQFARPAFGYRKGE